MPHKNNEINLLLPNVIPYGHKILRVHAHAFQLQVACTQVIIWCGNKTLSLEETLAWSCYYLAAWILQISMDLYLIKDHAPFPGLDVILYIK